MQKLNSSDFSHIYLKNLRKQRKANKTGKIYVKQDTNIYNVGNQFQLLEYYGAKPAINTQEHRNKYLARTACILAVIASES